jgi:hypothetical protein
LPRIGMAEPLSVIFVLLRLSRNSVVEFWPVARNSQRNIPVLLWRVLIALVLE